VLLAWSDSKRVFPISGAERLREVLPDARIEVVPDSRAFLPLDQPEALARHIDEFVATVPEG
jgi:pimeloyl-ACP methyl ester carboxylesterase